jgi:hypothetical protein
MGDFSAVAQEASGTAAQKTPDGAASARCRAFSELMKTRPNPPAVDIDARRDPAVFI